MLMTNKLSVSACVNLRVPTNTINIDWSGEANTNIHNWLALINICCFGYIVIRSYGIAPDDDFALSFSVLLLHVKQHLVV